MNSLRSILVSLHGDDSESPSQDLAIAWARRTGAELTGLAVVDETVARPVPVPIGGSALQSDEIAQLLSQQQRRARSAQEAFARRCHEADTRFELNERRGVPHDVLIEEVQGHDVVVVGEQTGLDYGVGESPSQALRQLIGGSPRPLVAVPKVYRLGETILVAYDGSELASRALLALIATGLHQLGALRLLTVDRESEESARASATRGLRYLQRHGVEATLQTVVTDRPVAEVICEQADRQACELIAMGPHGRSVLAEFFVGSVTTEVLDHASVPVFLFH